jgi:hypothetical protein
LHGDVIEDEDGEEEEEKKDPSLYAEGALDPSDRTSQYQNPLYIGERLRV